MHPVLDIAKKAVALVLRGVALVILVGGVVFPFVPNGYFALLPFLVGAAIWALSDFQSLMPAKRRSFKSDRRVV